MPTLAIVIFAAVFIIATIRNIHLGVLMIPTACAVGVWLAGMSLRDVVAGFPINILILVAGVTYFFGIAQANGTIDRLIQKVLVSVGSRPRLLPYVIFLITTGVAAMGSAQAGYVMIPLAMLAATCEISVWPRASSISAFTAVMAIGVSCRLASRNSAVTTISMFREPASLTASVSSCA